MKRVFIGHRGVGKTSLLQRHQAYYPDVKHLDLDQIIAEGEGQSISEVFINGGEEKFRELEERYFKDLISLEDYVISVGGGFNVSVLPEDAEVIYVSRRTDSDGRLFLDRPRLENHISALDESILRYNTRDPKFRKRASWVYQMPEGEIDPSDEYEEAIFKKNYQLTSAYYTLKNKTELDHLGFLRKFELRTDVFSLQDIHTIINEHEDKNFLVAVRSFIRTPDLHDLKVDWALELGDVPNINNVKIVSIHDGEYTEAKAKIQKYENKNYHLKFCPVVRSWTELRDGYKWQKEDRERRSFLPRTDMFKNSKSLWRWFRLYMLKRQKINFVQSTVDFDDQISFYEFLREKQVGQERFGAVIGHPVHHSRTPQTHGFSLQDYGNVYAIPVQESDFDEALPFLQELGLKFVAVTSPLKYKARVFLNTANAFLKDKTESFSLDSTAAINTLFCSQKAEWLGTSTDEEGFRALATELEHLLEMPLESYKIVIWGGGGVSESLKAVIPSAIEYSARQASRRDGQDAVSQPDVVIWAAPRREGVQMPPEDWCPRFVLDINYMENSMGIEYAQKIPQVKYISGLEMFYAQAEKQLKFWMNNIAKD
ncbi:MAG: shikimate kinase [Pseudobdellovibrio sp.]